MEVNFSEQMRDILDDYALQINDGIEKVSKETITETVKDLKSSSPKKSGKYGQSWAKKDDKNVYLNKNYIIYNKKYYQLTHLLEYGHATVNGGRVQAKPHIKEAETRSIRNFENKIKAVLNGRKNWFNRII